MLDMKSELLRTQMERLAEIPLYQERFGKAGVRPQDIRNVGDLVHLPFLTRKDLEEEFHLFHPPFGRFSLEKVIRINLTPTTGGFLPILFTRRDIDVAQEVNASLYRSAGVTPFDIVANCMSYHAFIAGLYLNDGFQHLGCKVIPLGPGESERAAAVINSYGVTVLASNPSFAVKLANAGASKIHILIAGGEPFSKDEVRRYFNHISIINSYSLAECSPVARECKAEKGSHIVEEYVYVEVVDPETGKQVREGEKGEIVVTHLQKEAMPLLRFRTGDLTILETRHCSCGRSKTMQHILGRCDLMVKVKGVKVYPSQVASIARTFLGLTGKYRLEIEKRLGVDYLAIVLEGSMSVDKELLNEKLRQGLFIEPNDLKIVEKLPQSEILDRR
jgi:phenylacetate-CoA ligase